MKTFVLAAIAASFFVTGAAYAQDMKKCDEETFNMVMADVDKATDEAMKKKGMEELDMAKAAMDGKMNDECSMHLDMAAKAVMMQ